MRKLINMNTGEAKSNGWSILKELGCEVVGKAVFNDTINRSDSSEMYIMKSTKRFKVDGGWIYNTSTEIHKGQNVAIAEALVFVPSGKKK